ncbi:MAG: hypothetical protein MUP82_07860, partial [Candidatus Marinimicrobia bacterium]|nr:hypothetical protein [Candidatus Neomarinimicrobiota bacterium]
KKLSKFKIPLNVAIIIYSLVNGILSIIKPSRVISTNRLKKFCTDTEYYADKIRQAGYEQKISTKDGLKETIEWNKAQNWQIDKFDG